MCVHAPTEDKTKDERDIFYENIEDVMEPKYIVKIVLSDFMAKVGREQIHKEVTGSCSQH